LFQHYPVVTHETHRVKLDKIGEFDIRDDGAHVAEMSVEEVQENESKPAASELFVALMSSINPFAKFLIQEISEEIDAPV